MRYGVLTAFEDDPRVQATRTDAAGVTTDTAITGVGRNFGVARFLYENAGAGRQAVGYIGTHVDHPLRRATVHGVDAGYLSPDGKLRVELQGLASDVRCTPAGDGMSRIHACPDDSGDRLRGYGGWADFYYTQRQGVQHVVRLDYFDDRPQYQRPRLPPTQRPIRGCLRPVHDPDQRAGLAQFRHQRFRCPLAQPGRAEHPARGCF